jgi:hypothetical protein
MYTNVEQAMAKTLKGTAKDPTTGQLIFDLTRDEAFLFCEGGGLTRGDFPGNPCELTRTYFLKGHELSSI